MRNKSRSANRAILGGRVEVLAETGLRRGRSAVVLMAGAYVPDDSKCCPDQNEEAGNRDGKEDLHHQKDIKAHAPWGIPFAKLIAESVSNDFVPLDGYELGSSRA